MLANGLPQPSDVRALFENMPAINTMATLTMTGATSLGLPTITGLNTLLLKPWVYVSGAGIPAGSYIVSVDVLDPTNGQITISENATASGTLTLTFTYYSVVSDNWIQDEINNGVIPLVQRWTRIPNLTVPTTVEEYYDGTGSSVLVLRRRPVLSLVSLSYTNVDSNLYYLTPSAMQLISDDGIIKAKANFNESTYTPIFWKGERNLRIKYQVGSTNCPTDLARALKLMAAERALGYVADQQGGGNLSVQAYSRDFGKRGRYTNIRNMFAREAWSLLRQYQTGTI